MMPISYGKKSNTDQVFYSKIFELVPFDATTFCQFDRLKLRPILPKFPESLQT